MVRCSVCGSERELAYKCNYCGNAHCSDHRLPEKHRCISLRYAKTLGPDFRVVDDTVIGDPEPSELDKQENDSGVDIPKPDEIDASDETAGKQDELGEQPEKTKANDSPTRHPIPTPEESRYSDWDSRCTGCGTEVSRGIEYCMSCRHKGVPIGSSSGDDSPPVAVKPQPSKPKASATTGGSMKLPLAIMLVILLAVPYVVLTEMMDDGQSEVVGPSSNSAAVAVNQTPTRTRLRLKFP